MHSPDKALPYMDKALHDAWKASGVFAAAISHETTTHGLTPAESEIIKVRVSQLNACVFCLDLHSRQARKLGVPQQKLDLLPAWREATLLPLTEEGKASLLDAREVLGEQVFVSAEWVAASINLFNRISILSGHPARLRDDDGKLA